MKSNEEYLDEMCFLDDNGKPIPKRHRDWIEWIDVKDELPKKAGIYWVCYEINGKLKSHYCLWEEKSRKYQGNKWGWRSREFVRRENIQYWTHIPQPPKEKNE